MSSARSYDVVVSYNSRDRGDVVGLVGQLKQAGREPFFDLYELMPGQQWLPKLTDVFQTARAFAVCIGHNGIGEFQRKEIEIAREAKRRNPETLIIPVLLSGYDERRTPLGSVGEFHWIDLRSNAEAQIAKLSRIIAGERFEELLTRDEEARRSLRPFRGLRAFREDDAPFFFGRAAISERLTLAVENSRSVTLVGPSGSGKSSVIHAGLLPRLRRSSNGTIWGIVSLRPGQDPIRSTASVLADLLEPRLRGASLHGLELQIYSALSSPQASAAGELGRLISRYRQSLENVERVLLVVDQLEELLDCKDAALRDRFVDELWSIARDSSLPVSIVAALRLDHQAELLASPKLAEAVGRTRVPLEAMTQAELREAIEEPARVVELGLQDGLVDTMLRDMAGHTHALPVLSFMLEQMWLSKGSPRMLTNADYKSIGGIKGVVRQQAQRIFEQLSEDEQKLARSLLLSLVRVASEDTQPSRRAVEFDTLAPHVRELAERLAAPDMRLLARDQRSVEISHDALLTEWATLADWISQERSNLLLRETLERDAREWAQEPDQALRSERLQKSPAWLKAARQLLDGRASYLLDSAPLVKNLVAAVEQHELEQRAQHQQKERRRLKAGIAVAATVALICSIAAISVFILKQRAEDSQRIAIDASNVIVNRVSRSLGETQGVPPVAISNVLDNARSILERVSSRFGSGSEPQVLKLTGLDVQSKGAMAHLLKGDWKAFEASVAEAERQIASACPASDLSPGCALRRAELDDLKAMKALQELPSRPDAARQFARSARTTLSSHLAAAAKDVELLPAIAALPAAGSEKAKPQPSSSAPSSGGKDCGVACEVIISEARTRMLEAQALALALTPAAAVQRAPDIEAAIGELGPCIDALGRLLSKDTEHGPAAIIQAACYRVRAALRVASQKPADAEKDADKAIAILEPLSKSEHYKTNLAMKAAIAEARIVKGAGALSSASPGVLPRALVEGFGELRELIAVNRENAQLRARYLQLWRATLAAIAATNTAFYNQLAATEQTREQITIRSAAADYALEGIQAGSATDAERTELRRQWLRDLQWLGWAWTALTDYPAIIARYGKLSAVGALDDPALRQDDNALLNLIRSLSWTGRALRDQQRQHQAVKVFLDISDLLKSRPQLKCNDRAKSDHDKRLCYFVGDVARTLGVRRIWQFSDETNLDEYLSRALELLQQLRSANADNIEFQSALADLKVEQGRRHERKGETQKALSHYQEAAQLGSADAIFLLRDWQQTYLQGRGDGSAIGMAINFEQRQRDLAPVRVEIEGTSPILRGGNDRYTVYLVPPQTGVDPLTRELERLENYYGVTPDAASLKRLRDILAKARSNSRSSNYTSRELVKARTEIFRAEQLERPFNSNHIEQPLKDANYALLNSDFGKALEILDRAREQVSKLAADAARTEELEYEWGLLGLQYLRLAELARRRNQEERSNTTAGGQMLVNVIDRALRLSDESFDQALRVDQIPKPAVDTGTVDRRIFDRGNRFYKLGDKLAHYYNEINDYTEYYYRDRQTYRERVNELLVHVLDRAIALVKSSRSRVAGASVQADRIIIDAENMRGSALGLWSTNRPRPRDVHQIAKRGGDFRYEAFEAYESALAHLASYSRGLESNSGALKFEINATLGIAKTHALLNELEAAVRVAEKATRIAEEFVEANRGDLEGREQKATAHDALASHQTTLANRRLDAAVELWDALGRKAPSDKTVEQRLDKLIENTRALYDDAKESHLSAIAERVAMLRLDPDASGALHAIRRSVRQVVLLTERRMRLDYGKSRQKDALTEAKQFAEAMVQNLIQSESRVSGVLSLGQGSRLGPAPDPKATAIVASVKSDAAPVKSKLTSTKEVEIKGVDPFVPEEFVRNMRQRFEQLDQQHGQLRADRNEIAAISRYVAALAYDLVAEFSIRANPQSDIYAAYRDAARIYEALVNEIGKVAEVNSQAAEQYAITMSNLAYALTVLAGRDGAGRAREALQLSERAKNIDANLITGEPNILINYAHALLASDNLAEAQAIYFNTRYRSRTKRDARDWCWAKQVSSDLAELKQVFPRQAQAMDRIVSTVGTTCSR